MKLQELKKQLLRYRFDFNLKYCDKNENGRN